MADDKRKPEDALAEMRSRYVLASDHCAERYDEARDDIKFVTVPGNQWDSALKARRKNRPTYEFPKLRLHTQQVINEMRQQRPSGKVRGAEESDKGLAELMQGICRNIESSSNAERAYDIAYEKAIKGGYGVWRITTDYLSDDDFEQDIQIQPIRNPFAAKCDPAAVEIDRRDASYWFVEELISRDDFTRRFPKASLTDFDDNNDCAKWKDANQIRIAEYLYKKPIKRELLALSDGRVVFADDLAKQAGLKEAEAKGFLAAAGVEVVRTRDVDSHKVYVRLTNGHEWLTEPHELPTKFIPIVPVWGNIENIDGEDYWSGMVRFAKDQQRLHNVHRTAAIEAVAKSPKAPFIVKMAQIKGLENYWKNANAEDYPYLPVNDTADDVPQRTRQAEVPAALIQLAGMDTDDMKAATGQFDASLGARSNETSGIAINSRKQQGATATFNYIDNLAYAIKYTWEILVDMIPRVYDTQRTVRVLGEDGGEKWKKLYQEIEDPSTGQTVVVNDIRQGKYDVVVTVGPSYATQRMEAAEAFSQLAGQIGAAHPAIGPLLAYAATKNMDLPGMDEFDTALRKVLVGQGLLPPKEGEQPPPPPQPNPKEVAEADLKGAQAKKVAAETQQIEQETMAGMQWHMASQGVPPPDPYLQDPMNQPPQGGFFMPDGLPPGQYEG